MSTIVTLKLTEAEFPWASVATQVTFVVPRGKVFPDGGEHVTGTGPSTSSTAVGDVYVTTEPAGPSSSRVMFAGTLLNTGAVVSTSATVTVNVFCAVFP